MQFTNAPREFLLRPTDAAVLVDRLPPLFALARGLWFRLHHVVLPPIVNDTSIYEYLAAIPLVDQDHSFMPFSLVFHSTGGIWDDERFTDPRFPHEIVIEMGDHLDADLGALGTAGVGAGTSCTITPYAPVLEFHKGLSLVHNELEHVRRLRRHFGRERFPLISSQVFCSPAALRGALALMDEYYPPLQRVVRQLRVLHLDDYTNEVQVHSTRRLVADCGPALAWVGSLLAADRRFAIQLGWRELATPSLDLPVEGSLLLVHGDPQTARAHFGFPGSALPDAAIRCPHGTHDFVAVLHCPKAPESDQVLMAEAVERLLGTEVTPIL